MRFDPPAEPMALDEQRLQARVLQHLQAEFRAQDIDVCASPAEASGAPLATLGIGRDASNSALVKAWANDSVTQKELTRRLSLVGLPDDAHALAIALGASELLEASWAELRLASRATQEQNVPTSVRRRIAEPGQNAPVGDWAVLVAAEAFGGGVRQYGLDVQVAYALTSELNANARLGGRSSLSATSAHGSIVSGGWLLGAGLDYVVFRPTSYFRLLLAGRTDLMRVDFTAEAKKGAVATAAGGIAAWSSAGLGIDLRLSPRAAIGGAVFAGRVWLPLSASDDSTKVFGLTKGLVAANAGVKIIY